MQLHVEFGASLGGCSSCPALGILLCPLFDKEFWTNTGKDYIFGRYKKQIYELVKQRTEESDYTNEVITLLRSICCKCFSLPLPAGKLHVVHICGYNMISTCVLYPLIFQILVQRLC